MMVKSDFSTQKIMNLVDFKGLALKFSSKHKSAIFPVKSQNYIKNVGNFAKLKT